MAKVLLTQEARDADFAKTILKQIHNKSELGRTLGMNRQKMQYRFNEVYPKSIVELKYVLEAAGYEIKQKPPLT